MPIYDYVCTVCDYAEEKTIKFEDRDQDQCCSECGEVTVYQFPMGAAKGYMPFESYYDESLNMDIHGIRHKQQVMKALNVIESGDKVGGARNYDEKASTKIEPNSKLSGRTLDTHRREQEKRQEDADNFHVSTVDKKGKSKNAGKAVDLPDL